MEGTASRSISCCYGRGSRPSKAGAKVEAKSQELGRLWPEAVCKSTYCERNNRDDDWDGFSRLVKRTAIRHEQKGRKWVDYGDKENPTAFEVESAEVSVAIVWSEYRTKLTDQQCLTFESRDLIS